VPADGTIFAQKQADNITALTDDGSALNFLWETEILGNAPFSQMCVGSDGSVYAPSEGMIIRLDPVTGLVLDSSEVICGNPELFQLRASATQNDLVFATNGENAVYAFSLDLKEIWSDNIPNVNTSGAAIGTDGVIAVSGANIIKVYTPGIYAGFAERKGDRPVVIYPNPAGDFLNIQVKDDLKGSEFFISDQTGRNILDGRLINDVNTLSVSALTPGWYILNIGGQNRLNYKLIKK
jgi:hypothetical protein